MLLYVVYRRDPLETFFVMKAAPIGTAAWKTRFRRRTERLIQASTLEFGKEIGSKGVWGKGSTPPGGA